MGDYYNLDDIIDFFDFLCDTFIGVLHIFYGIYFTVRIIKNSRKYYIDMLKIIQLLILLFVWVRFIVSYWFKIFTFKSQTQLYYLIFVFSTYCKRIFILLTQFSWYILIQHIKIYGNMIHGKSFSEWKSEVQKIERIGILIIVISTIVLNIITVTLEAADFYFKIDILSEVDELIMVICNIILLIINYWKLYF